MATLTDALKKIKNTVQSAAQISSPLKTGSQTPYQAALAATEIPAAGTTGWGLTNTQRYDFWQNSTDEEKSAFLNGGGIPASYTERMTNGPQNYVFWNSGRSTIGDYGIDESNSDTWRQISELYNSGNVDGAMELVNGLSDKGRFGGYYDDNGSYWGFAQGYLGGANASYQPVLGGNLIARDVDTTGTNIWLTPDGKAMKLGANGALVDNGDTWTRTRQSDPARYYAQQQDAMNGNRPYGETVTRLGSGYGGDQGTIYQQTLAQYPSSQAGGQATGQSYPSGGQSYPSGGQSYPSGGQSYPYAQAQSYPGSQPTTMSYEEWAKANGVSQQAPASQAPAAYDPSTDTLYKQWLEQYGNASSPEWQGGEYDYTANPIYRQYIEQWQNAQAPEYAGDPYQAQRDKLLEGYGQEWGGSEYQPLRDEYTRRAAEMEWDYDPNTDPVFQAYQKQYRREGQRATEDTLGRYAAMTGGMPSTAAVTAASQAGDYYASQLSDKIPQLYQDAYNRYLQEYQKALGISDQYASFDDREYQRWLQAQGQKLDLADRYNQYGQEDYDRYRDRLSQWNTDRSFGYGAAQDAIANDRADYDRRYQQYLNDLDRYNTDRSFGYNAAMDSQQLGRQAVEDQYRRYLDEVEQARYADERDYSRYRDTVADQRYDQEWAQQLREYADAQNWKAKDWEQYLREYDDQLSWKEREWAYKQYRDAVEDDRYEREFQYQQTRDQASDDKWKTQWDYGVGQDLLDRERQSRLDAMNEADWKYEYGDESLLNSMGINPSKNVAGEYAYSDDGTTYKFTTDMAKKFVQSAPNGTTMRGSDGSIWRKDEYGNITIEHKGKVYRYGEQYTPEQQAVAAYEFSNTPPNTPPQTPPTGGGKDNDNIETISSMVSSLGFDRAMDEIMAYNDDARANGWPVISQEEIMEALQLAQ